MFIYNFVGPNPSSTAILARTHRILIIILDRDLSLRAYTYLRRLLADY